MAQKNAAPKAAAAPKPPKPAKVANKCGCGCGGETFRTFLPGHDAKLKGRLIAEAVNPESTPAAQAAAEKQLNERGWGHFLDASRAKVERKAEAAAKRALGKVAREELAAKRKADSAAKAQERATKAAAKKAAAPAKKAAAKKAATPATGVQPRTRAQRQEDQARAAAEAKATGTEG